MSNDPMFEGDMSKLTFLFSSCSCYHVNRHKRLARAHTQLKINEAVRVNTFERLCHESLNNTAKSTGKFSTNRNRTTQYIRRAAQDFSRAALH